MKRRFKAPTILISLIAIATSQAWASAPSPRTGMYVTSFEFSNVKFNPETTTALDFSKRTFALNYGYEVGLYNFLSLTSRATLGSSFPSNEVDVAYDQDGETLTKKKQPNKLALFYQIGLSTNFYIPQVPFLQFFGELHYISYQLELATYQEITQSLTDEYKLNTNGFGYELGLMLQPREAIEIKIGMQQDFLDATVHGVEEKLTTQSFKLGIGFRL
jgi:hypothetical protein